MQWSTVDATNAFCDAAINDRSEVVLSRRYKGHPVHYSWCNVIELEMPPCQRMRIAQSR